MTSVRTILVILIVLLTAAALAEQGQDRPDSKCERTNKTDTKMGGSCGFVCKDLVLTPATGEAKASGFQYVCSRRTTHRAQSERGTLRLGTRARSPKRSRPIGCPKPLTRGRRYGEKWRPPPRRQHW